MATPFPYNEQPEGFRLPKVLRLSDQQDRDLRAFLWERIVEGDVEECANWAKAEFPALHKKVIEQAVTAMVKARRNQIASWPDHLRQTPLTRAFEELAGLGIVARENFSCCGTCASSEIWDERDDSRTWRGYVYFHTQDAERIPQDRVTYLGYGVFLNAYLTEAEWEALSDEAKEETYARLVQELMAEAIPVFQRHGIEVEWNQDLAVRILLKNVDWYAEV